MKKSEFPLEQLVPVKMRDGVRVKLVKHFGNGVNSQFYPKLDGSLEPHGAKGSMKCGGGSWGDNPWTEIQLFWADKMGLVPDSMLRNLYIKGKNGKPKKTYWDGMEALNALEHIEKVCKLLASLDKN